MFASLDESWSLYEKGNRCGWYAVPNSSFVSQAVEVKNNSINDSFGGTK